MKKSENGLYVLLRLAVIFTLMVTGSAIAGSKIYFVHTDHLGTPQVLTDQSQTVVWKGEYTPFGEVKEVVNTLGQNVRFPGQYDDRETGYYYNYFRDYDPSLGRYVQSDPIGLLGGINTYSYAYQNPLMYTDPKGLTPAAAGLCFIPGVGWVGLGVVPPPLLRVALRCFVVHARTLPMLVVTPGMQ